MAAMSDELDPILRVQATPAYTITQLRLLQLLEPHERQTFL